MEQVRNTELITFYPDTVDKIRNELELDQDAINKLLDNFEDWIAKQPHFTKKEFSRSYLEQFLVASKGSLERAKKYLDKLCTLKTLLPNFFEKYDSKNELIDTSTFMVHSIMPKALNSYRVYAVKFTSSDFDAAIFLDYIRFLLMMAEYGKFHDYTFGSTIVIDCKEVNIVKIVSKTNVIDLRNTVAVTLQGHGFRINGIYLVSASKTIDVLVALLKQLISEKIAGRIHVVRTMEELHQFVPKELLPKDFGGGEELTLKEINEKWINVLSTKENVAMIKDIFGAKTDEKFRSTAAYNDEVLGMPGSFRSLSVD